MRKRVMSLLLVMTLLASVFVGCTGDEKEVSDNAVQTEDKDSSDSDTTPKKVKEGFSQAPMFDELVKSGELPPVEDRLPVKEDIMIEEVLEEIGQYGGQWRFPWGGIDDKWDAAYITEEALFRFRSDGQGVEPNVAKGYEVNADSTEYTIYLREGMKWSDGEPFNADDVLFYWEHMLIPETFGKDLYDCYYSVDPDSGDKARAEVEKIDDYTVKVTHKYPNALFLERVAIDNKWFFAPEHFYKTILPEFVGEDKALEIAKEWGFNDLESFGKWTGYYYWVWSQRPTLRAWVAKNDPNSEQFIMERNPYFWKTDAEGNQLPYLDTIAFNKYEDTDQFLLEGLAGNVDIFGYDFKDFTVLKENEAKGDYRILQWSSVGWSSNGIELNQASEDPKLAPLLRDIRFREALSLAVDRVELSEITSNGLAVSQQASVPKGLPNYQEGWAEKWTEYNVERAAQLLDEIGLKWDANNEFRTFEDGSELQLVFYTTDNDKNSDTRNELIQKYYQDIGIKTIIKMADEALYQELKYENKIDATFADCGLVNVAFRPDNVVPMRVKDVWNSAYGLYKSSNGEEGVKPEGDMALLLEYWDNVVSATTSEEVYKWCDEIIKLHEKNVWLIGYTSSLPNLILVNNKVKNVPDGIVSCDEFRSWGHARPVQFFIEQ
ncbi:ABC transporter substrate-binding protein [Vallitalea okinawensis]|uniref:ABC transporter substrate-binding protein n=1 Tax=Vallitalea okinawensis TaxID=2078660 RepID=UPI000CFDA137|nr:ABC transporter substrate-binding protein [Vallitalea okinawensis]